MVTTPFAFGLVEGDGVGFGVAEGVGFGVSDGVGVGVAAGVGVTVGRGVDVDPVLSLTTIVTAVLTEL